MILDYVPDANDRIVYLERIKTAKKLYREKIQTEMFNAYMEGYQAIKKDVMNYVNMIIVTDPENIGPNKIYPYKDPQTGELKAIKIDQKYVNNIEERLGLKTKEQKNFFRIAIRKKYGEPEYDFMDNSKLVKAVIRARLDSEDVK